MPNVGALDRILRGIIGLALIILPFLLNWPTLVMVTSIVVGLVLVGTAALSFCPIYALLGISSKSHRRAESR